MQHWSGEATGTLLRGRRTPLLPPPLATPLLPEPDVASATVLPSSACDCTAGLFGMGLAHRIPVLVRPTDGVRSACMVGDEPPRHTGGLQPRPGPGALAAGHVNGPKQSSIHSWHEPGLVLCWETGAVAAELAPWDPSSACGSSKIGSTALKSWAHKPGPYSDPWVACGRSPKWAGKGGGGERGGGL